MTTGPVLLEIDGPIATIRLNRPDAGNAIDVALAQAFLEAVIRSESDPAARSLLLTGSGSMFCAGGDVNAFAAAGDGVRALIDSITTPLHDAIARLMRMPKPVITVVNGAAAGAGLGLAVLGDVAIAAKSAKFAAGYGGLGVTPDAGVSWLLPKLVGLRQAQRLLLTTERLSADEAERIGLISSVVEDVELANVARSLATKMASLAGGAIGLSRNLLHQSFGNDLETHLREEARLIGREAESKTGREGVRAFLDRRKPNFQL
ncbi:MAG: enoyl-CoA hydratase/isomerase family protein [Pseudomonadota bacterium]|nr:enoyl-CoA hydratase/isomerase family protein [Pseudomonadota bacterium]